MLRVARCRRLSWSQRCSTALVVAARKGTALVHVRPQLIAAATVSKSGSLLRSWYLVLRPLVPNSGVLNSSEELCLLRLVDP